MDVNKIIMINIWIVFILLVIHNCHRIIKVINEHFETDESTNSPVDESTNSPTGATTKGPCPLAYNIPEVMKDKWGDNKDERVKVFNNGECHRCSPGTYIDYENINVCSECPENTYSDTHNAFSCKPCQGANAGSNECSNIEVPATTNNKHYSNYDINLNTSATDLNDYYSLLIDDNIENKVSKMNDYNNMQDKLQRLKNKYEELKSQSKNKIETYYRNLDSLND